VLGEKDIKLTYTEEAANLIAVNSYSSKFGARNMRRYIQSNVEDKLAELIISDYERKITQARIYVSDGEISVACL
jgi:ATP-dependent Clp protease ATP-binding subunit ClpA